jgi:5'-nucleotidase
MQLQLQRLDEPARPGVAFSLVTSCWPSTRRRQPRVEVVILSRNDPVSGMRVFRSAQHYGLPVERGVFTRGEPPWRYLRPLAANLFLSTNDADVRQAALAAGRARRARLPRQRARRPRTRRGAHRLRRRRGAVQRRGRAVFQREGLDAFQSTSANVPPRRWRPGRSSRCWRRCTGCSAARAAGMRLRTALVTARSAPAHERAIRTLMDWQIEVDEAMFLGGLPKGEFLREFEPDFFFDDQTGHIENAAPHVPAGHVPVEQATARQRWCCRRSAYQPARIAAWLKRWPRTARRPAWPNGAAAARARCAPRAAPTGGTSTSSSTR